MPARTKTVNLLPPSDFENSFWGQFLKWAVSAGRYIIIITEMVVIVAFLSRFKLDQDMADLAQTLEGQKRMLELQAGVEQEFRDVQGRLEKVNSLIDSQLGSEQILNKLVSKIPPEVKLVSMAVKRTEIDIQAVSLSEKALGEMLAGLTIEPAWKGVEVTEFSADSISGIKLIVSIKY